MMQRQERKEREFCSHRSVERKDEWNGLDIAKKGKEVQEKLEGNWIGKIKGRVGWKGGKGKEAN